LQRLLDEAESSERFLWLSLEKLRDILTSILNQHQFPYQQLIVKELETTKGFNEVGYGAWFGREVVRDKIMVFYDEDEVNPVSLRYLQKKPEESRMLHFTTAAPALYYWSNTLDLSYLMPYLLTGTSPQRKNHLFQQRFANHFGLDIENFLNYFTDQASMVIEPGDPELFLEMPKVAIIIETTDIQAIDDAVRGAVTSTGISVEEENYLGLSYLFWKDYPQDGLQLLCGFYNEYFILANSANLIRRIIQFSQPEKGTKSPWAERLDPGFTRRNNSVTYFQNAQLITMAQRFFSVLGTVARLEDQRLAQTTEQIFELLVDPVLEGAKMYQESATRSYFTGDLVVVDSLTKKKGQNQ
jgi:hypothetical protein